MKMLAFDTSSAACSVALCDGDKVSLLHKVAPMQQAALILPMINDVLASFSLTINQLDAIAFGCGPGSFTGVRLASCVAQGLSFGSSGLEKALPIIRISSLAALAKTAYEEYAWEKVLVAVDARSEQVYWAIYESNPNGDMALINKEELRMPQDVTLPNSQDWMGIGNGWEKYQTPLIEHLGFTPECINISVLPKANALIKLAKVKYEKGDWVTISEAHPDYLR